MIRRPPRPALFPYTKLFRSAYGNQKHSTLSFGFDASTRDVRDRSTLRIRNRGSQEVTFQLTTRSQEHTSELQSRQYIVCRLLLEKKKSVYNRKTPLPRGICT